MCRSRACGSARGGRSTSPRALVGVCGSARPSIARDPPGIRWLQTALLPSRAMRSGAPAAAALLTACLVAACGSQHHASRTGASVVLPTAPPKVVHPVVHHRTHPAAASKPAAPFHARAELITHGPRRGHDVALTFDADMTQVMLSKVRCGLHSIGYDPEIVRELRASHTQATIFMTGLWPTAHPAPANSLAADPLFEIENHSYDHAGWAPPCYGLPLVR